MESVTLQAANGRSLRLDRPRQADAYNTSFYATLTIPAGRAHKAVSTGGQPLAEYFVELASHWRGWTGPKTYETPEGDFLLSATHDGLGTVALRVTLCKPWWGESDVWSFEADLEFGGGAELERIARDMRDFSR